MTIDSYQALRCTAERARATVDAQRSAYAPPWGADDWRGGPRAERRAYLRAWVAARAALAYATQATAPMPRPVSQ